MIILDTSVLSALMHQAPDKQVIAWLDQQPRSSVWTTSVTLLEIHFGLRILPNRRRRTALMQSFERLLSSIGHRIAWFDPDAAQRAADLMAVRRKRGHPADVRDTMIAGIVLARRATLATRNPPHFKDASILLINPWAA
jgi:toxin FitB